MADDIVQQFVALPTKLRVSALGKLLHCLLGYEWRHAHAFFGKRNFYRDIVGDAEMPLEILILIFSHLPLIDAFTCQQVKHPLLVFDAVD
jgi:hypothetical protein